MRYKALIKVLLLISFLSFASFLKAAEIRNGQLYLEVLIEADNNITLRPEKESDGPTGGRCIIKLYW